MPKQKQVEGAHTGAAPEMVDSKDSTKIMAFRDKIDERWADDHILFGKNKAVVRVSDFADEATLTKALTAYAEQHNADTPDEFVAKSLGGVALTLGDIKAWLATPEDKAEGQSNE